MYGELPGGLPDFTLAGISGLDWNRDMVPWDLPGEKESFTGGADDYLRLLTGTLLPAVEDCLPGPPGWRGIAGYSLGGLFALYALCRTEAFHGAASVSGSLWFPGIVEYLTEHEMSPGVCRVYLSVGSREARTRNPLMRPVRQNAEAVEALCRERGIRTTFVLNPGNHFFQPARRTAAGIAWLLGGTEPKS